MQRRERDQKSAGDRPTDRREIGRELTRAEDYPSMKKAMELLKDGLRINLAQDARQRGAQGKGALPTHKMEISANCPSSPEFDSARDITGVRLHEGDLQRPSNNFLKAAQMQALTRLLNVGRYRAKGYQPPMQWSFREKWVKYAASGPDLPKRDGAEFVVWGQSLTPVAILPRDSSNTLPRTDHEGVGGVAAIPEKRHKNNCSCLELVTDNPVEFSVFSTWCLPAVCANQLENRQFRVDGSNDVRRYLNTSLSFFSKLSEVGTVYQRLVQRTPLSSVSRGAAKMFMPPAANVDLVKNPTVLKAIMAQVSRAEYVNKIPRYTEDAGPENQEDLCRFPPVEMQRHSIDVKAREGMTIDEIINNSALTSPYYGDMMCCFCCNTIKCRDISDVYTHLIERHKKLQKSWFSCPACLSCVVLDWTSYTNHWLRYHSSCLALMVVLDEANVSPRLCFGLALHSWIVMCRLMNIRPEDGMNAEVEAPILRSAIGGYAEKASFEAVQLVEAIREDQTEYLPRQMAEEVRRAEALEAAKKREAEKRKREAAEMPPPDTWSLVASRGRSKTLQSSSRLSSGEGCSSWGELPPKKKMAARPTLGEVQPLFQKGEKEKKTACYDQSRAASGYGYDPSNPGYSSAGSGQMTADNSRGSYTPDTERISPPPAQQQRKYDLATMVQQALEGIVPTGACDEDALYNEAIQRTPCAPGTEDDVLMDDTASGPPGDAEQAERYLDEEDAL